METENFRARGRSTTPGHHRPPALALLTLASLVVFAAVPFMRAEAQYSVAASATVRVAPVMTIRATEAPVIRSRSGKAVDVARQVTVASNSDYVVNAIPLASLANLHRAGVRVSALQPDGSYAEVSAGSRVPLARGARGGASVTTVVLRFEGAGHMAAEELMGALALQVVVEAPNGGLYSVVAN